MPHVMPRVLAVSIMVGGMTVLHANIQMQNDHLIQVPRKKSVPRVYPTMMVPKVVAQVIRGETVDVPIVATPFRPSITHVKILIPPKHGRLTQVDNIPEKAAVFRYVHDRDYSDEEETFTFLVTDSLYNPSGSKQTGRILIRNPHATLVFTPDEKLDFGNVPIGETVSKKVTLSNEFGSTVTGALRVDSPWRIEEDPFVVLSEGHSRTFTISFTPKADGEESSRVSFDPDTVNLPELILYGSGHAPFELVSPVPLQLTKDSPKASVIARNRTDQPITVVWKGNSSGLEVSPPVSIPARGTSEVWVSSKIEIPTDMVARRTLNLCSKAYSLPVKFEISGPKGGISVELLRGGEMLGAFRNEELLLEGIVRNSSETERELDVGIENPEGETKVLRKHLLIRPRSFENFQFSFFPRVLGEKKLPVLVTEGEKVVAEDRWQISVQDRIRPAIPVLKSTPNSPAKIAPSKLPQGGAYLASENFKAMVVADIRPLEERGILMNHLVLEWRYFGPEKTFFAVEEKHIANVLTDRTGDESAAAWKQVEGTVRSKPGGIFSIRLPIPHPGIHEYRIYPVGMEQAAIAPVTLEISQSLFWWPWIRSLLIILFLIALLKFIMERL